MKFKDIKTRDGQQELFRALVKWGVYQSNYNSLTELLNSSETVEFIKDYIEDVSDVIAKEVAAIKLQQFFLAKSNTVVLQDNFNLAVYEKTAEPEAFSRSLPELNTTDKIQPDAVNKRLCAKFSKITPTDVFLFPCAGRGSDALYVCSTYNVSKDHCFFVEINPRLCARLKGLGFKNIICGDIMSDITWNKLYNMLKENRMIINKTLMNPPYDGDFHLKVLETTLAAVRQHNPNCEIVSIQPCDWLENQLTPYKDGKYKKFFNSEVLNVSNLQVVDALTAQKSFNIGTDVDLGIYTYKPAVPKFNLENLRSNVVNTAFTKIINKILVMQTLADVLDENTVTGWRCKLNELRPQSGGTNPNANGYSHKTWGIQLISSTETGISECVFKDGYNDSGIYWTDVRSKNQFGKNNGATFRHSIEFENQQLAINFAESCNTNFYRNWIYLIKFNQHMPLKFLPYMEDYSKVWTDEDYCKFFDLTEEESEFMCRTVDDYRVKDFINYISLED